MTAHSFTPGITFNWRGTIYQVTSCDPAGLIQLKDQITGASIEVNVTLLCQAVLSRELTLVWKCLPTATRSGSRCTEPPTVEDGVTYLPVFLIGPLFTNFSARLSTRGKTGNTERQAKRSNSPANVGYLIDSTTQAIGGPVRIKIVKNLRTDYASQVLVTPYRPTAEKPFKPPSRPAGARRIRAFRPRGFTRQQRSYELPLKLPDSILVDRGYEFKVPEKRQTDDPVNPSS